MRTLSVSIDANKSRRESVSLEGAFKNPGIYYLKENESLFDLIERSGGYTNEAYIDGGIFLRASVAKREKDGMIRAANENTKKIIFESDEIVELNLD